MKTLKDYIYNINEDWEKDLDQSKLHFAPKNIGELQETLDCLKEAKNHTDITDWLVEAFLNYAKTENPDKYYYGRYVFDDQSPLWYQWYGVISLTSYGNETIENIIKEHLRKQDGEYNSSRHCICLAHLYDGNCKIGVYAVDKFKKDGRLENLYQLTEDMKYDFNKSFGENLTHFLDEAHLGIRKSENKNKKTEVENPAENAAKNHTDEIKDELKNLGLDKEIFQKVANKLANLVLSESINEAKISAKEVRQMVGQMREKDKEHIDMVLTNLFLVWEKIKMLGLKSPDNVRALLSAYEKAPEEKSKE